MRTLVLMCCAPGALGQTESGEKIYQRTLRGTTWILGIRDGGAATGTGALIDVNHKWVITNFHVAGEANRILVFFPRFRDGKLIAERSEYQDLLRKGRESRQKWSTAISGAIWCCSNWIRFHMEPRSFTWQGRALPRDSACILSGTLARAARFGFIPKGLSAKFMKRTGAFAKATPSWSFPLAWWRRNRQRTLAIAADRS